MKKEVQQHFIYLGIFAIVIIGLLFYSDYEMQQTRESITELSNQLQEAQNTLTKLQEKDQSLEKSVQSLDTSLEEKDKEIESLSGELEEVKTESEEQVAQLEKSIADIKVENEDFSEVIEDAVKGVVSVQTNVGAGSGFIINIDGTVVTNYHVIEGATAASVITHDGGSHRVTLVGFNKNADIAVLKINATGFRRLRFADSDDVKVGERVIAIGNPGGLDFTVTQGIISATREEAGREYVQIDVPINPGNSGGPLINSEGKVVGVNTLKIAGFEGVGFALTSNYVDDVVDRIMD